MKSVYSAVRTGSLNKAVLRFLFKRLNKDLSKFSIISRSIFLKIINVSHKSCRENQNTHLVFKNFFFPENCGVCEVMYKDIAEPAGPQTTIWSMRIACWIPKTADTHNMQNFLLFHCNDSCTNAPQYYVCNRLTPR